MKIKKIIIGMIALINVVWLLVITYLFFFSHETPGLFNFLLFLGMPLFSSVATFFFIKKVKKLNNAKAFSWAMVAFFIPVITLLVIIFFRAIYSMSQPTAGLPPLDLPEVPPS